MQTTLSFTFLFYQSSMVFLTHCINALIRTMIIYFMSKLSLHVDKTLLDLSDHLDLI